jgi:hypothetical protein
MKETQTVDSQQEQEIDGKRAGYKAIDAMKVPSGLSGYLLVVDVSYPNSKQESKEGAPESNSSNGS